MKQKQENFAYIDGANLHVGATVSGIKLDYKKFRIWLEDKFNINHAYIFLGNIPKYGSLYIYFQDCGYKLVFKEVVYDNNGKPKGNCDADLVLSVTQDFYTKKFNKVLLVSSDGDYASLVSFLQSENKLLGILSPSNKNKCSILLKKTNAKIYYLEDHKNKFKKEKTPDRDFPL